MLDRENSEFIDDSELHNALSFGLVTFTLVVALFASSSSYSRTHLKIFGLGKFSAFWSCLGQWQEMPKEIGESLCQLFDREYEEDPSLKRDTYLARRRALESGYCYPDEGYIALPMDMPWSTKGMVYPSYLYQYHNESSGSLLAHHGFAGVFPPESLSTMASKGSLSRHAHRKGSTLDTLADGIVSSQVDRRQMSSEMSPLCSTLSKDEFLEMVVLAASIISKSGKDHFGKWVCLRRKV